MKQYLLSIYQPDGDSAARTGPGAGDAGRRRACDDEMKAAGAWVFAGGLHPPSTATVVRVQRRRRAHDRRPVRRGQGAHRRLHRSSRRPISTPRSSGARKARAGDHPADRGAAVPGRRRALIRGMTLSSRGDRTGLPRGVRPRGGRPGPRLRRHRRRRGGGPGRVHRGRAALAVDRAAAEPGGMDHHHRPQPGDRPVAPRGVARGPARPGRSAARARRAGRGGRRARRPAAPDLHLLPPGARRRRAGRADAAAARRAHHRGDRARLPGARADDGAAAGAGQGQDPRRADPVPGPERGRPAGPPPRRAGRRLPDLQRGLHGELGRAACPRRPVRRGDPPRPAAGRADARRAGGHGAARADAAHRVAPRRAHDRGRRARAAGRPGPRAAGIAASSPKARRSCGSACGATSPARTRSRRRSTPSTATRRPRPPPTGGRSCSCTTSCCRSRPSPVVALNRAVAVAEVEGPDAALALVDASTSIATTCSTRSAPTCSGAWAATPRPRWRTTPRSPAPRTRPSASFCSAGVRQ